MHKVLKKLGLSLLVTFFVTTAAQAGVVEIENGDFISGDYLNWQLSETGAPTHGTWGVVDHGSSIEYASDLYDYHHEVPVTQTSYVLRVDYVDTDGTLLGFPIQTTDAMGSMSIFLNNRFESGVMVREVAVPPDATKLSWDMFYHLFDAKQVNPNLENGFAINQCIRIALCDNLTGCVDLFVTVTGEPDIPDSPFVVTPTQNFTGTIPENFKGQPANLVVEVKSEASHMIAGFDNFKITTEEIIEAPPLPILSPGWGNGAKKGWDEGAALPPGLVKRTEKMLEKNKSALPPGLVKKLEQELEKGKATAPGQMKKKK